MLKIAFFSDDVYVCSACLPHILPARGQISVLSPSTGCCNDNMNKCQSSLYLNVAAFAGGHPAKTYSVGETQTFAKGHFVNVANPRR